MTKTHYAEMEEFIAAVVTRNDRIKDEMLWRTFHDLDRDNEDTISFADLGDLMKNHGNSDEYVKDLLSHLETTMGGSATGLSYEEFENILRSKQTEDGHQEAQSTPPPRIESAMQGV